jgi:predicted Fe-Mo cluster-binding NifX family protein
MKLAISIQSSDPAAQVDSHFGRAAFFRIVDTETGEQTTVDNAAGVDAVQGAGPQAAQTLARLNVSVLLTGQVGPKAWNALQAAGIQVYSVTTGTAGSAVQAFLAGQLPALTPAGGGGH